MNKILGIDIGNTAVHLALITPKRIRRTATITSAVTANQMKLGMLREIRKSDYRDIDCAMVCSVVPAFSKAVMPLLKKTLKVPACLLGRDIDIPIKNNYAEPKQVGQDRLLGGYAAKNLYGTPAVVIDLGTAVTFEVISAKGSYEGGMILPGIRLSLESLSRKTALLPDVKKISKPKMSIGKDTRSSILSGLFYGYGTMCSGLIRHITKKLRKKPKVILTGGYTRIIKDFIDIKGLVCDEDLLFKGMRLLCRKFCR